MSEEYVELREQLKQESPELYESLMRSWKIANEQWLAAVSGNKGCFNAYPHIRNHERYANEILKQAQEHYPDSEVLHMRPIEKYLLLAAMLLHDIGRSQVSERHAERSQEIILNNHAALGVDDEAIAQVLADICCYHDCPEDKETELDLREHSITPYGVIHARRIAVLLKFIDNLDGAYTRVYPYYIKGDPKQMIEGVRRSTGDIRIDMTNHMVVTTPRINSSEVIEAITVGDFTAMSIALNKDKSFAKERERLYKHCKLVKALVTGFELLTCYDDEQAKFNDFRTKRKVLLRQLSKLLESLAKAPSTMPQEKNLSPNLASTIEIIKVKFNEIKKIPKSNPSNHTHDKILEQKKINRECVNALLTFWNNLPRIHSLCIKNVLYGNNEFINEPKDPFHVNDNPEPFLSLQSPCTNTMWRWDQILPHLIIRKLVYANPLESDSKIKNNGECARVSESENESEHKVQENLVKKLLAYAIVGNVRSSDLLLNAMRMDLNNLGVPLDAWLLEINEHLFVSSGMETFEPSLSRKFLKEVVDAMWRLSACIFSTETYSYQTLAAKLRVTDINLVRTSVRRIGIVTRHRDGAKMCHTIGYTENEWRWNVVDDTKSCKQSHDRQWVLGELDKLVEPWQKDKGAAK